MERNNLFQEFVNHMHVMDEILFKLSGQRSDKTDLLMEMAGEHGFKPAGAIIKSADEIGQWTEGEITDALGIQDMPRLRDGIEPMDDLRLPPT